MRKIDRVSVPPPQCLSDDRSERARAALREIFDTDRSSLSQNRVLSRVPVLQNKEIDQALDRLFDSRCPFCERRTGTRPYRFRPTEEAGPSSAAPSHDADLSHLYYCWLANSWQNLYSICEDCRPREESVFPTLRHRCPIPSRAQIRSYVDQALSTWPHAIAETPLLLDPCGNDNFALHMTVVPDGKLIGLSARGDFTIEHFSLNRPQLVDNRRRVFEYNLDEMCLILSGDSRFAEPSELFDEAFGGSFYWLLKEIAKKLATERPSSRDLSQKSIGKFYRKLFRIPGFEQRLGEAVRDLLNVPEQVGTRRKSSRRPLRGDARPVSFTIENFKALERVEIAFPAQIGTSSAIAEIEGGRAGPELAPAVVILGENAAGKSSILEAMALALSDQNARADLELAPSDCILKPEWMGGQTGRHPAASLTVRYENGDHATVVIGAGFPFREVADLARIPVFAYGAFRLFRKTERRARPSAWIRSLFEPDYVLPNPEHWLASLADTPLFEEVARALKMILVRRQMI